MRATYPTPIRREGRLECQMDQIPIATTGHPSRRRRDYRRFANGSFPDGRVILAVRPPIYSALETEAVMRWIGLMISGAIFLLTTAFYIAAPAGNSLYI